MNKMLKMMLNFYGPILSPNITNEPPQDKTNIMTCASAQSDQSLRCALNGYLMNQAFFMRTAKTLIRLGGSPGCSESLLGAHAI